MNYLTLDRCLHGTELSYETGHKLSHVFNIGDEASKGLYVLPGLYCSRREHSILKIGEVVLRSLLSTRGRCEPVP